MAARHEAGDQAPAVGKKADAAAAAAAAVAAAAAKADTARNRTQNGVSESTSRTVAPPPARSLAVVTGGATRPARARNTDGGVGGAWRLRAR